MDIGGERMGDDVGERWSRFDLNFGPLGSHFVVVVVVVGHHFEP